MTPQESRLSMDDIFRLTENELRCQEKSDSYGRQWSGWSDPKPPPPRCVRCEPSRQPPRTWQRPKEKSTPLPRPHRPRLTDGAVRASPVGRGVHLSGRGVPVQGKVASHPGKGAVAQEKEAPYLARGPEKDFLVAPLHPPGHRESQWTPVVPARKPLPVVR